MILYDRIGVGYDTTRRADPRITQHLCDGLGPVPREGRRVLDLACGTGNYTVELARRGFPMVGLDISGRMLRSARVKEPGIPWLRGSGEALPFATGSLAATTCTLATHHFQAPVAVFREVKRVVADGPFVLLTTFPQQMRNYWLNEYFPRALLLSIEQMPDEEELEADLRAAGFGEFRVVPFEVPADIRDQFLYCGKERPEVYFDARVRSGISTFANLASSREVEEGLSRLRSDLESDRFAEVRRRFPSERGDYAFVIAV